MDKNNKYVAQVVEFNFSIRLHCFLGAFFSRKDVLKTFCLDENIDYPIDKTKKYYFNEDGYCVRVDDIEYLAKNRDKIILALNEQYKNCQDSNSKLIINAKKELADEKSFKEKEKLNNTALKERYKRAEDPLTKIDLEVKISDSETRLKNCTLNISNIETKIKEYENVKIENVKSWRNQISLVDALFDTEAKKYIQSCTKKIRRKLNFTKFNYFVPDYSDDVKEIIEGK